MKLIFITLCLLTVSVHFSWQQNNVCNTANCIEPNCKCVSTSPPAGLPVQQTPQMVILSFDGAITKSAMTHYNSLINGGFLNPNGCPISMSFFVFHEYNDYNLTTYLYNSGQEIGVHSLTHKLPADNWANYNATAWGAEMSGMSYILNQQSNIPRSAIRGQKSPYLQSSGDATFTAMKNKGFEYDVSYTETRKTNPPIWPYTMDFGLQHECNVNPCPTKSHPGLWTFPMVVMKDKDGDICSQVNCQYRPINQQETFNFLLNNFKRHYQTNRAPFIISQTSNSWFLSSPHIFPGFIQFLSYINNLEEVYVVSMSKALDWMKKPVSLITAGNPGGPFSCPAVTPVPCSAKICPYDEANGVATDSGYGLIGGGRFVTCSRFCPDGYPWLCNPAGSDPVPAVCNEGF